MTEITDRLQVLKEEMEKLEKLQQEQESPEGSIEYRYCIIRELSGYGTEDWNALVEWAKRQKNYLYFTMDPDDNKEAFYFSSTPNSLILLGLNRAGLYICTNDKFCPKTKIV